MPSMVDDRHMRTRLEQSLDDLVSGKQSNPHEASKIPAKQRNSAISIHVDAVCKYAYRNGLPLHVLNTVLGLIRQSSYIDQPSINALLRHLYPDGLVPSGPIYSIVSSLGEGRHKPSSSTQLLLLKWVILVYDVLEDRSAILKMYGILFNMLDMISIRAPLCHILALVTQKEHVRPFRIHALSNLFQTFGPEQALVELMRIYRKYHPDIIIEDTAGKRAPPFTCPDPEWRGHLRQIHAKSVDNFPGNKSVDLGRIQSRESKRLRISIIPALSSTRTNKTSARLEEIHTVDDLVNKLDVIEEPSQLISALDNTSLQRYLVLKSDELVRRRLDHWLAHFFEEELCSMNEAGNNNGPFTEVLRKLLGFTRYIKILPPSSILLFERYLPQWDGIQNRDILLHLLTYLNIQPFEDLQRRIFALLENAILNNTAESAADLLHYYNTLLSRWLAREIAERDKPASELANKTTTFNALIEHISLLSLSILCSYAPDEKILSTVISYYETLAYASSLAINNPSIFIDVPAIPSVYLAIFLTTSLSSLSRSCSILATFKKVFDGLPQGYPSEHKNSLNSLLMDTCNLLWRSRAFNTTDSNALGCLLPTPIIAPLRNYVETLDLSLASLFSLSHSTTVAALSIAAFRNLEYVAEDEKEGSVCIRHAGPVTQKSLLMLKDQGGIDVGWTKYRLKVLSLLDEMGVGGIGKLMFCTMKDLIGTAS